jgi:low temperature requirement protein LtrA
VGEVVQIAGAASTAKVRSPIWVAVWSILTLGIYVVFWWYFINREMADYGRAQRTSDLGDSPTTSTLALFPGGLIVVPAIWTSVTTFQRVQKAQQIVGQAPLNGWIAVLLYIVISPVFFAYMQSGLNSVWRSQIAAPLQA